MSTDKKYEVPRLHLGLAQQGGEAMGIHRLARWV